MSQQITITIDGMKGVQPLDAARIQQHVFKTLQSIDRNSWAVGAERLEWQISGASLRNPLTITYTAEPIHAGHSEPPNVGQLFIQGCQAVEQKERFKYFSAEDYKRIEDIGQIGKRQRSLEFTNSQATYRVTAALADNASLIRLHPQRVFSFGSIEGTLVEMLNHPEKKGATAKILTRFHSQSVECKMTPSQADVLNDFIDRHTRVVLYGVIQRDNGVEKQIVVERFRTIRDDKDLPSLADIHELGLKPPDGTTIEELVARDEDEDA